MLTLEQLQNRRLGIGGSDAAAVCGCSKYRTPVDVYYEKLGIDSNRKETSKMKFGNKLENVVAEEYEAVTGNKIMEVRDTLIHKDYNFIRGNIDRALLDEDTILECKTSNDPKIWGEIGSDEIPDDYLFQCAHYAEITGCSRVDLAVLISGHDFRIYSYKRDEAFQKKILRREVDFWENHVKKEMPPEPTSKHDVEKIFSSDSGQVILLDDEELEKKIIQLVKLQKNKKEIEESIEKIKEAISIKMAGASELRTPNTNYKITYKQVIRKTFDSTLLKKENPELYEQYTKETSVRMMRVF